MRMSMPFNALTINSEEAKLNIYVVSNMNHIIL